MTSDITGEVRCPSCGRLTALAPFCTHCGAVIPEGASGPRPHAMDRQELEERARQLHGASSPFRRGVPTGDGPPRVDAWASSRTPEPFVPEPSDELARRADAGQEGEVPRVDFFEEQSSPPLAPRSATPTGTPPPIPPPAYVPPVYVPPPPAGPSAAEAAATPPEARGYEGPADEGGFGYRDDRAGGEAEADPYGAGPGYAPDADYADYGAGAGYGAGGGYGDPSWPPGDRPPRRSAALPVVGFVVLGVAALLGGALLFSTLNAPGGLADQASSPSPSAGASAAGSETPNASASDSGTPTGSSAPSASAAPDNFTAKAQPCASNDMGFSGCSKDGSTLTGSQVWVWVGFKNGQADTVLGVTIIDKTSGSEVGDGSLELDKLTGCDPGKTCSGYIQMTFGDLSPGSYTIQVSRDGSQVSSTGFTVSA
jgi:hypothetical protein